MGGTLGSSSLPSSMPPPPPPPPPSASSLSVRRASSSDAHESPRSVVLEPAKCELLGNENGKYSLVGEMVLDSDADSLYAMLTDYAASPKIFATVDACDVSSLPDGKLLVSQSCRWKFMGVFGGAFPCHLAVLETPTERYMEVELHERGFIREFEGSWRVSEEPGGGVRVRHTLALRPALTPPYAHKIFLKQIGDILTDVEREVASWGGEEYVGTRKKAGEGAGDAEPLPAAR